MLRKCLSCDSRKGMDRFEKETFEIEYAGHRLRVAGLSGWRCGACGEVEFDEAESREGAEWVANIERENAGDLTPEKIAAMEKEAVEKGESDKVLLDEAASPTAGRRFTRA